uniref:Centrosomin N-terminal motif 1 domain-containing protein n=1 Tax=Cyprinus carpio TaxID=7962 RepID=A0A8C1UUM9_CYPCA
MFNGYRTISQHLNDLKKENFSLKLRIYFLEERFQQKFEDSSSENVHRRNIELKVEVESLKQELQERQEQTTAEGLTNQNEVEVQRRCEERQQEIGHMQEILETKIQLLQEEAQLARSEAEKMAYLADSESQRCLALERRMMMEMQGGNESLSVMAQHEEMAKKDR